MEMDNRRKERLAKVMDKFLLTLEARIEEKIPDWKNENPYNEEHDYDHETGKKTCRTWPTTSDDAREDMSADFIASGEDTEILDCSDFFEYCIFEIYGTYTNIKNPYFRIFKEVE